MTAPRWRDTFASWRSVPAAAVEDVGSRVLAEAAFEARRKLDGYLEDARAVPIAPYNVQVSNTHAFPSYADEPPLTCVLVEVRALRLRIPNPFPAMRLFGRWLP